MKRVFLIAMIILISLTGCEQESNHPVTYRITNSDSGFDVNYRDGDGILQHENIITQSAEDVWNYSFEALEGDIVFISAIYKDINSAIHVQIILDGKVFKQGSSTGDTTRYVTVSGTVPY